MIQNFTYLAFLCSICMLLIIGGVLLTNLSVYLQVLMILIGLVGGIVCFITLIRVLISYNNGKPIEVTTEIHTEAPQTTLTTNNKKRRPQSRF